eukprot:NODE_1849_length_1381_cov_46.355856_g1672_i0.p1 GENE.NODE_1849_length_1381_cov_46.355856_g1672_i0~~NODE_1849_length_1381_cov_46.355856_g1672_i0.p1  ORF type:complete len:440 (-),score=62.87 NODE_1849_length_1381_cov_46.355856_g1672_i0:62-1318(-)
MSTSSFIKIVSLSIALALAVATTAAPFWIRFQVHLPFTNDRVFGHGLWQGWLDDKIISLDEVSMVYSGLRAVGYRINGEPVMERFTPNACSHFEAVRVFAVLTIVALAVGMTISLVERAGVTDMLLVIFGASGNCGRHLCEALLSELPAGVQVRLVTRDATRCSRDDALDTFWSTLRADGRFEVFQGDVTDRPSVRQALEGAARVFLCLPQSLSAAGMRDVQAMFRDVAVDAGVEHVVKLSSYGIDDAEPSGQGPLGEAHVEGERIIRAAGISLTSVRPTSFSSNFIQYDLPSVYGNRTFSSPLGAEASVNWVACADIGRVCARAMINPEFDGQTLNVTGPAANTLSASAMAGVLTNWAGAPVVYSECPVPDHPDMGPLWQFLRSGGFAVCTPTVKDVTQREPTDFRTILETLSQLAD